MKNDKKIESETKSKKIDDKKTQFDHELIISALTRLKDLIKREENLIEKKTIFRCREINSRYIRTC